jgi:hypothetical protein
MHYSVLEVRLFFTTLQTHHMLILGLLDFSVGFMSHPVSSKILALALLYSAPEDVAGSGVR